MKIEKRILNPERLRRCPAQFSFIEHSRVPEGYVRRAEAKAWALYLMLVTVGDEHGLSYYSERSLSRLLSLPLGVGNTRRDLSERCEGGQSS